MYVQDKAQNWNQGMTREALILAKANGTLRSLGATDEEISTIIQKFHEPEGESIRCLQFYVDTDFKKDSIRRI